MRPYSLENCLIEDAVSDGWGLFRHEGRVIFVENAIPGDVADVEIFSTRKKIHQARVSRLVSPSPHRRVPQCRHFNVCGGCKWQMMTYEQQLFHKNKQVTDALTRIGGLTLENARPIIGAADEYGYRNKVEYSFSNKRWLTNEEIASGADFESNVLGYHVPKYFDKVVNIDECWLHEPRFNDLRNALLLLAKSMKLTFHDAKAHTGLLRNLLFRAAERTGDRLVMLIVHEERPDVVDALFEPLTAQFPWVTSWMWMVNPKMNDSFSELSAISWRGEPFITEKLAEYAFRISPTSFFQTNTAQTERLYGTVKQLMGEIRPDGSRFPLVYDLYCGAGSIGIYVSELAEKIVGVEYVESSIHDARANCELNNLNHLQFHAGDLAKVLTKDFVQQNGTPDLIITDPPRAGMDAGVVKQLLEIAPANIIYVSCNAATQARDLALMRDQYNIKAIQPVDMFPQTTHVESVVWLAKKN